MSSDSRSRLTLLESYSIAVAIENKGGRGRGNLLLNQSSPVKGASLRKRRCLKAYLLAIAANWDEIRTVEGRLQIASFSLLLPKIDKGVVTLLQVNFKAIYALDLNF